MLSANPLSPRLKVAVILVALAGLSACIHAQEAPPVYAGNTRITGLPDDWTHHHLVFSNPGTEEDAIKNGTHEQWLKIVNDPRYVIHQLKRNLPVQGPAADDVNFRLHESREERKERDWWGDYDSKHKNSNSSASIKRDWSMSLAGSTTIGAMGAGQYPAKYSFSINSASCSDYVVYATGLAGSGTQASIIAYNNLYTTTCPTPNPAIYWAYNTGGTVTLSPVLYFDGVQVAFVQNAESSAVTTLSANINAVVTTVPVSSGSGIATGDYIQIDSEIMHVTAGGGTTSLTVVRAQLGTVGAAHTSPANVSLWEASLVILTMANSSGTVGGPVTPTLVTNANYKGCTAPCYTTIAFNGGANDTNSAPYYDYDTDSLYVGDNNGFLHKFTNIFGQGAVAPAPSEITGGGAGSGWPQSMASGVILTGPVYYAASGIVFVGSSGGILYRIPGAGGSTNKVASAGLAVAGSTGIVDAPLIDSMPGTPAVYVFVGDATGSIAAVEKFTTGFGSGTTASASETVSSGSGSSTTTILYDGTFDNLHYSIAGGAGGFMYVCGVHATGADSRLYQITMNAGFTGAVASPGTDPSGGASQCSPVTEFLGSKANTTISSGMTIGQTSVPLASGTGTATGDYLEIDSEIVHITAGGGTASPTVTRAQLGTAAATHSSGAAVQDIQDWIYLSVTANGTSQGTPACAGSCLYNYAVTTGTIPAAATAGQTATGGTSGISIDNFSTAAGASQIYYTTLGAATCAGNGTTGSGTHGCAVQASQSAP